MKKLNKIIKGIMISTAAISSVLADNSEEKIDNNLKLGSDGFDDSAVQNILPQVPQLIIKQSAGSDDYIISQHMSHKSHRSHGSHRSHSSHTMTHVSTQ